MTRALLGLVLAFAASERASAQIQNQPVEIVEAAPLSSFSERAASWPSLEILDDDLNNDRADLSEKLNSVPGIQARTTGSPVVSIRGSGQADRTLRLFEGLPLNMADGVGASEFFLPYETIGSLSVIKGPASVFYGGSAMAGAIDHRLRFFERNALRVGASEQSGSLGPRNFFGALVTPPSGKLDRAQVTLFHERNPGSYPFESTSTGRSGRRENSASDLSRATFAGDATAGDWSLSLRGLAGKSVGETPGALHTPLNSTYDTTVGLVSLEGRRSFATGDFVSLRVTDSRLWGLYDRGSAFESSSSSVRSSLSVDSRTNVFGIGLRTFGDGVTQSIAGTYLRDSRFHQFDGDLGQSWEIPISSKAMLQPAYRYRSTSGDWSKALGLVNDEGRSRRYLTYSEGFRTASLSDRFGDFAGFKGNPSLNPEKSWSVEAGFSSESGERYGSYLDGFAYGGAVFYTDYQNLFDSQTTAGVQTRINAGHARSTGFELNSAATWGVWMFSGSFSYLDARNLSASEPLRLSPLHQLSISAAQQLGPVVIEIRDTYWSEFYDRHPMTNALTSLPSWNTIDVEFRTLGLTDWEFKGGIMNAFDESRELTMGYPEPQRRVFASALRYF